MIEKNARDDLEVLSISVPLLQQPVCARKASQTPNPDFEMQGSFIRYY
jgi:hypothetical protein